MPPVPPRRAARTASLVVATVGMWTMASSPALAHGIGGRADLPVPVSFFAVGAGLALVMSFVALAALWPDPRLQQEIEGPVRSTSGTYVVLGVVGALGLAATVATGLFDAERANLNPAPFLVWIVFWLVIPFLAVVVGNLWRALSPWPRLAIWLGIGNDERPERVANLGFWPATAAFVAFTWLELVSPQSSTPRTIAAAAVVYTLYALAAAAWAGRNTSRDSFEAFHVYNELLGAISPFQWTDEGIRRRGWLRGLPQLPVRPGLVAFVVAMIGTVTYDGLSGTEWWSDVFGDPANEAWFGTIALLAMVGIVGAGYWLASAAAARLVGSEISGAEVARSFAHTLVPIAFAYAFAHYFTLVLFEGQGLIAALSDPFSRGWNLFGTAGWRVNFFMSPEAIWYIQVAAIVAGHVAGVVLAHDRALHDFKDEYAVRSQYAMLLLMVGLTSLGLFVLSG